MSISSGQSIHLQPLESRASGSESGSTAQQQFCQPHESHSVDVEREANQGASPSAKPLEEVYIPRKSMFIVHVTHTGKIVHRQRFWVTARSSGICQNLPEIPPNGIRVVIRAIGVDDQAEKCLLRTITEMASHLRSSGLDDIPYTISWRERWRMTKKSSLNPLKSSLLEEFTNLVKGKRLARLNTHRL